MRHSQEGAEMIARVLTEHLKLAGDIASAPAWMIEALSDIHQSMNYLLQRADEAAARTQKLRPEHIAPHDVLVPPQPMGGEPGRKVVLILTERAIDVPNCFCLYARPNPACPAWQQDSIPKLVSEVMTDQPPEPAYLTDLFKESPGDFSRTQLIVIDPQASWELQRQLALMSVSAPYFGYATLLKFGESDE